MKTTVKIKTLKMMILLFISLISFKMYAGNEPIHPRLKTKKDFVVYNLIRYKDTPSDLSKYGLSSIIIHPPGTFLDVDSQDSKITGNTNLDHKIINKSKLETLAKNDSHQNEKIPVVLDIEAWGFGPNNLPQTIEDYKTVIEIYKSINPNATLGFYGSFPQTKYKWDNISNPKQYQKWQSVNNQLTPMVKKIQFFAPSLYCRDHQENRNNWKLFAQANLDEAQRYGQNIPIYAFISPQYEKGKQFIDANFWNFQLQQLYEMGYDGVIIWTSNKDENGNTITFDQATQQDWWSATLQFLKK
jgi:hypothetical protein